MSFRWASRACVALGVVAPMALSTTCAVRRDEETLPPEVPVSSPIPVAPMSLETLEEPLPRLPPSSPPLAGLSPAGPPAFAPAPAPAPGPAPASAWSTLGGAGGAPASDEPPVLDSELAEPPPTTSRNLVLADELPYRTPDARASGDAERSRPPVPRRRRGARPYHPDPRVFIEVMDARGDVAIPALQRSVRNLGYWPVRRCYEEGLRRDQRLSGQVALDLTIYAAGAVERARVASSSLGDESVALCVGREVEHLLTPPGPAPADVRVEVTLSTGDEPVPTPLPAPDAEDLREALRASWPAVEQCYAAELARRPGTGGRLELRFRAMSTGEVVDVAEGGAPRFSDGDITRCVLGVYRTARLPARRVCSSRTTSFYYAMHLEARR